MALLITATGPTVERSYVFPDADATILTTNTAVTVAQGGTGLATLTAHAVYVGNGASAQTAIAVGATGTVFIGNTGADPSWSAAPTVTSLTVTTVTGPAAADLSLNAVTGRNINFNINSEGKWILTDAGIFSPVPDGTLDLGLSTNRVRSGYFGTALIVGTNPSTAGAIRVASAATVQGRNAANSSNLVIFNWANTDILRIGDSTAVTQLDGSSVKITSVGPHASGTATDPGTMLYIAGTFSPNSMSNGVNISPTLTATANSSPAVLYISATFTEFSSGTHALFATARIEAATVTGGAATVTNTASLYIAGPMTATVSGLNYALWIAAGTTIRFGGFGAGAVTTDANGNIVVTSDGRLKEQVRDYEYGLDAVRRLRPVRYRWNELSKLDRDNDYAGFIAQEVESVMGSVAIGHDENGHLTLQDRAILAATVKAVQELYELVKK